MSNAKEIIIRPLVTEKTLKAQEKNNTVVFEVAKKTNAIAVRNAIEEIFNVKVEKVSIVNVHAKTKRVGKYVGKTNAIKKAYIQLKDGYSITILQDK